MNVLILFAFILVILGIFVLLTIKKQKKLFGSLNKERIYVDTKKSPGEILYSKTTKLMGKPDYIIREGEAIIPVEVKTGKTPSLPYTNHTMQLMAYCMLVHENFGVRPKYGIVRYEQTNTEFKIKYTAEVEESLRVLIHDVSQSKIKNIEYSCTHPQHNS